MTGNGDFYIAFKLGEKVSELKSDIFESNTEEDLRHISTKVSGMIEILEIVESKIVPAPDDSKIDQLYILSEFENLSDLIFNKISEI